MGDVFSAAALAALAQVILLDIVLAGDNAVAVGLAASRLPPAQQRRVILIGIGLALVLRIAFALVATQLMQIPGLLLVGGVLLVWVAWKMWRDLSAAASSQAIPGHPHSGEPQGAPATFRAALLTIVAADVSMSLDNVLAVAGAAREHPQIMAFGLVLSVALMGLAASIIARAIERHRWIAWVGVGVIVLAAFGMIWEDMHRLTPDLVPPRWNPFHHG